MRLWHFETIPFLPKGQLLAQWRELNSIFVKEDKHVLINYIYEYPKDDLYSYTQMIVDEMANRGYKIRSFEKMHNYFGDKTYEATQPFAAHHNDEYLQICYFNLKEKFIRGQKDYEPVQFEQLHAYYCKKFL